MAGGIVLVGGDEFRPGCEEMDSFILRATGEERPRVLILPTADIEAPQKAASNGVGHFSRLGAVASALMVLNGEHANDEDSIREASGASLVYFTGGSPDHLLATLRGSKLLDILHELLGKGKLICGSSAGAMVMGSMMRRPSSGEWVQGLGVAGELAILPHHERSDPTTVAPELARTAPLELKVMGIDAKTCCFGSPGRWKVLGEGKVTAYQKGSWSAFSSGQSLREGY